MNEPTFFNRLILRTVLRQVSPMVIRLPSVSDRMELSEFHRVIRLVLGWKNDLGYIVRVHGQEFNLEFPFCFPGYGPIYHLLRPFAIFLAFVPRRRWIVERTNAWLGQFRRLLVRHEHLLSNYYAFFYLACFWITLRHCL
jgi:hypothetical protein